VEDKECLKLIMAIESESNLKRSGRFIVRWRGFVCYIAYNFLTKKELIYLANMRNKISFNRKKDD